MMYFEQNREDVLMVKSLLSEPKKIVITTHHKPDGDAMGSSLGLYLYLLRKNHVVTVITPSDYPEFLNWLRGNEKVINYQLHPDAGNELIRSAEIIFALDFNDPGRVEKMQEAITTSDAIKILIDHHLDPKDFCRYTFSYPSSAATCELIYYFIQAIDGPGMIDADIAECLYTGIMTDTGSFRFPAMTAGLHRVIASLMESGARHSRIHELIYDNFSENRVRLLGYCLHQKLQVISEYHAALITLDEKEMNDFNFQPGDSEGFVNYALGIKGIMLAAFFSERQGLVKISLRSRDNFSVKELAEQHFEGGGHKNAAGGKSLAPLQQTVDKFIALLPGLKFGT